MRGVTQCESECTHQTVMSTSSYALGLWVEFVVGSQFAEGISLGTLASLSPRKTKLLFDLTRIEDLQRKPVRLTRLPL